MPLPLSKLYPYVFLPAAFLITSSVAIATCVLRTHLHCRHQWLTFNATCPHPTYMIVRTSTRSFCFQVYAQTDIYCNSAQSHVPLCHMTPMDPLWPGVTRCDRWWPLVWAMTLVGAFPLWLITICVGLSRMTLTYFCTPMTRLGHFPGCGLIPDSHADSYVTGWLVYKDTQLGDLFPKLLLKTSITNLARLLLFTCVILFIFFKIDTSVLWLRATLSLKSLLILT